MSAMAAAMSPMPARSQARTSEPFAHRATNASVPTANSAAHRFGITSDP